MQLINKITKSTDAYFCIILQILFFSFIYTSANAQLLQQSNNIKVFNSLGNVSRIVTEAPKSIESINLKIDTTNIYQKGLTAIEQERKHTINVFSEQIAAVTIEKQATQEMVNALEAEKRLQRLSEYQERMLREYKEVVKKQEVSIDSLTKASRELQNSLSSKTKEAELLLELKKQYRKEYFQKLIEIFKSNLNILDSNYKKYESELKAKGDSLSPKNWPLYVANKDTMVRSMAIIYSQLLVNTTNMQKNLLNLISDYPNIKERVEEFEDLFKMTAKVDLSEDYIDKEFSRLKLEVANLFTNESKHNEEFRKAYENYRSDFQLSLAQVNQIWVKYKPEETKQSSDASILANFTQPLNQSTSIIPGIDVFAYRKFNSQDLSIYGQAKLFLAAPGVDTNALSHATKFFVPEASQFGFMADFSFGFLPASKNINNESKKMLGLNFSFYYLQKQLVTTDSLRTAFSTGMLQLRTGFEIILVKNALSAYGNINGYLVGKGIEQYKKFYTNDEKFKWFSEFGLRSYMVLQSDAKLNLLLDLRFLPVGRTIKEMTNTIDKFVPLFKLGIVKEFEF